MTSFIQRVRERLRGQPIESNLPREIRIARDAVVEHGVKDSTGKFISQVPFKDETHYIHYIGIKSYHCATEACVRVRTLESPSHISFDTSKGDAYEKKIFIADLEISQHCEYFIIKTQNTAATSPSSQQSIETNVELTRGSFAQQGTGTYPITVILSPTLPGTRPETPETQPEPETPRANP